METIKSFPAVIIYFNFICAFLQQFFKNKRLANKVLVCISAFSTALSLATVYYVWVEGPYLYDVSIWHAPWGIEFSVGHMEAFVMMVICGIGFLIAWFGMEMVDKEIASFRIDLYNTMFLLLIASMVGIVVAGDMFNMYVFIEITSISACGIIAVKGKRDAVESTVKYLVYSSIASGCILLSIALLYGITGNLNMRYMSYHLQQAMYVYPRHVIVAAGLIVVGFGLKAALFPLHIWLPDAHSSAPTTSSAVLSGLVLKAYIAAMIKVLIGVMGTTFLYLLPFKSILWFLSSAAILIGSILAITQSKIKRVLAYSSIVQVGYIFLGLSLYNNTGFTGAIFHILNHALTKSSLFLAAGCIKHYTGKDKVDQLKGIGYTLPVPMGVFAVAALSMVGLPLTSGFNSKWYIGLGGIEAGKISVLVVIIISSLLNAAYYFPIVISAFFKKPDKSDEPSNPIKLPLNMSLPMIIIAILIIVLGVYPQPVLQFISNAVNVF